MIVNIVRYLLIAIAIALIPVWKLWIFGGWLADKRAQRRNQ